MPGKNTVFTDGRSKQRYSSKFATSHTQTVYAVRTNAAAAADVVVVVVHDDDDDIGDVLVSAQLQQY